MSEKASDNTVHVVSGDGAAGTVRSLNLGGEVLVWREALAFGPVHTDPTSTEFFEARATYLETDARELSAQWLRLAAVSEESAEHQLVFWFGRDLFCQVMLWSLISGLGDRSNPMSIALPIGDSPRCLTGDKGEFQAWFENRQSVTADVRQAADSAWRGYASSDPRDLQNARDGSPLWVQAAIDAHLSRFPDSDGLGSDERTLLEALERADDGMRFGPLFRTFTDSRGNLGWGDLGVVEILEQLASLSDPALIIDGENVASAGSIRLSPRGRAALEGDRDLLDGQDHPKQIGGVGLGSSTSLNWRWNGSIVTLKS